MTFMKKKERFASYPVALETIKFEGESKIEHERLKIDSQHMYISK